jgi:hypothetical protein
MQQMQLCKYANEIKFAIMVMAIETVFTTKETIIAAVVIPIDTMVAAIVATI